MTDERHVRLDIEPDGTVTTITPAPQPDKPPPEPPPDDDDD